jgi:hypothetical protein
MPEKVLAIADAIDGQCRARHPEVADRLGALVSAGTTDADRGADVVEIRPP